MILKVLKGSGWVIFGDFDRIEYSEIPPDRNICVRQDVFDFTAGGDGSPISDPAQASKKEVWLYRVGAEPRQILAEGPMFLTNDDGRTIERI